MASKFGGIAVDSTPKSKFGGVVNQSRIADDGELPAIPGSALDLQRQADAQAQRQARANKPSPTVGEKAKGAAEVALTLATGATGGTLGQLEGTIEGIIREIATGGFSTDIEKQMEAANRIEKLAMDRASQLTFAPRTEQGQGQVQAVAETLAPLAAIPPAAELQVLGSTARRAARPAGAESEKVSSILSASAKNDVPVLTTDIFQPESFLGRSFQSLSEKLGPLGTGSARTSQQKARIAAVDAFAEGIDIDTPFAESVVKSLNKKSAKRLEAAGNVRNQAVSALDEFGEFESPKSIIEIDDILSKQDRLGATANQQLTNELQSFRQELAGASSFSQKKDIRTQLIKKVKAFGRAEDTAPAGDLQQVKSALDKDLTDFARANDKDALKKWLSSNREFADELTKTKDTELKRILNTGEATPEKVIPILRGGRASELQRLYGSLGEKGRSAARGALIQQALKDSKFFEVDSAANPDALATALNRPNMQQAVRVFFKGESRKEIDGFTRLLDSTRKAQQSQAAPRTGEQLLVPGAGAGIGGAVGSGMLALEPTLAALTTGSALVKLYESKSFRNLLIRLSNTKRGSKAEKQAVDLLMPAISAELTVAREQPEQKEEIK